MRCQLQFCELLLGNYTTSSRLFFLIPSPLPFSPRVSGWLVDFLGNIHFIIVLLTNFINKKWTLKKIYFKMSIIKNILDDLVRCGVRIAFFKYLWERSSILGLGFTMSWGKSLDCGRLDVIRSIQILNLSNILSGI